VCERKRMQDKRQEKRAMPKHVRTQHFSLSCTREPIPSSRARMRSLLRARTRAHTRVRFLSLTLSGPFLLSLVPFRPLSLFLALFVSLPCPLSLFLPLSLSLLRLLSHAHARSLAVSLSPSLLFVRCLSLFLALFALSRSLSLAVAVRFTCMRQGVSFSPSYFTLSLALFLCLSRCHSPLRFLSPAASLHCSFSVLREI